MVTQNRNKLNTVSSLVVNGHHRVPPHPTVWPPSNPLGVRTVGLPTIGSRFSTLLAESTEVNTLNPMVARRGTGNLPGLSKLLRDGQRHSLAVRLLRPSLTRTTARSRIVKERTLTNSSLVTKTVGVNRSLSEILKTAKRVKKVRN